MAGCWKVGAVLCGCSNFLIMVQTWVVYDVVLVSSYKCMGMDAARLQLQGGGRTQDYITYCTRVWVMGGKHIYSYTVL